MQNKLPLRFAAHPLGLLFVWALWLSSEAWLFGPVSYQRQQDAAEANTAYYAALPTLVAQNRLGLWHPLAGSGTDALANLKGDIPAVEVVFRWLPPWLAGGLLLFLQSWVAGWGLSSLLRRRLGVATLPAVLAGAWYAWLPAWSVAASGFAPWHGWYLPALPVICRSLLWATERPWGPVLAVAIGATTAVGAPTASGGLVIGVMTWWIWATSDARVWSKLAVAVGAAAGFLILKAQTIIALYSVVPVSHRTLRAGLPFDASSVTAPIVPDTFELLLTSAGPLIVAALFVHFGRQCRLYRLLMTATLAIVVIVALDPYLRTIGAEVTPALVGYQWRRVAVFVPFLSATAAGIAWSIALANGRARHIAWLAGLLLVSGSLGMNTLREIERERGSHTQRLLAHPVLRALAETTANEFPFRTATFADANVSVGGQHPGFAWAAGLETADLYLNAYPIRYHEFWSQVIGPTLDARPDIAEYFSRWGNMAYLFNPDARLFALHVPGRASTTALPFNLNLLSLANVKYLISRVALHDTRLTLRRSDSGLPSAQPQGRWVRGPWPSPDVWQSDLFIYENTSVLPRYFLAQHTQVLRDDQAVLQRMAVTDASTFRTTAFLSAPDAHQRLSPGTLEHSTSPGHVALSHYTADRVVLSVEATEPALLFIGQTYSPHWTATINGHTVALARVNHTFQGAEVPAGRSVVELAYDPPAALGGHAAALKAAALILLVVSLLVGGWLVRRV